jgi:putative ABC transport system permease protein
VPGIEPRYGYREYSNPGLGIEPDVQFFNNGAGFDFIETYGMKLLAGNTFSLNAQDNRNKIVINESSLKHLGFIAPDDAIGKIIYYKNDTVPQRIVGVVANHHNEGLQKAIYPIVWNNDFPSEFGYFAIRVNSKNVQGAIGNLEILWKKHYPKDDFDYVFANENFNKQYTSEARFSKFYLWLTLLSISIATMGLYGLIIFYLEKRKKEIGIRKVNGARIEEVVMLLNTDFVIWVGIAFAIATPLAYYFMNIWLQNFAYSTNLNWRIFAFAGLVVFSIVVITVSWQSWRAATRNPVEALRYE